MLFVTSSEALEASITGFSALESGGELSFRQCQLGLYGGYVGHPSLSRSQLPMGPGLIGSASHEISSLLYKIPRCNDTWKGTMDTPVRILAFLRSLVAPSNQLIT